MEPANFIQYAQKAALREVELYNRPPAFLLDLSVQKGIEIAKALKADVNLVTIGCYLMDIKLGQALKEGRPKEHVKMGVAYSRELMQDAELSKGHQAIILNAVEAHHGTVPFESLEAEIVANADCYRFIHSAGAAHYLMVLGQEGLSHNEAVDKAQSKFLEKKGILTLDYCKDELAEDLEKVAYFLERAKE